MNESSNRPIIPAQTTAQNEAVEQTLGRLKECEVFIPAYQRDSDEWDAVKKSLFIESILNRLTVPGFYLAPSEDDPDRFEVVDGQQRLTTLSDFQSGELVLLPDDQCPYYGNSVHYAAQSYHQLDEVWQKAFRRYNLTLVTLPQGMPLSLRLEIFRRINEGGTPLSAQDIRLSYYSESKAVRFVQLAGIYDPERSGAKRMIANSKDDFAWPWTASPDEAKLWKRWWNNTKTVTGQTSSEMFLWYVTSRYRHDIDKILNNKTHLQNKLSLLFRNRTDEVLDIICSEMRYEDTSGEKPRLVPDADELQNALFPSFRDWWNTLRNNCPAVTVARYRSVALFIPALLDVFGDPADVGETHWGWIGRFIGGMRDTATLLAVDFPESKGRWTGERGQRKQLDAFFEIARKIKDK